MSTTIGKFFSSHTFKFMVIGILSLLLLIPAGMIRSLIRERENRSLDAGQEISESWSTAQTITGPFLTVPTEEKRLENRKTIFIRNNFHVLPESLNVDATVEPIEKKRGIFTAVVYDSRIRISGHFNLENDELSGIIREDLPTGKLYVGIGLDDLRGIGNGSTVKLNGTEMEIEPGLYSNDIAEKGIKVTLDIKDIFSENRLEFDIVLDLKGSTELFITPLGKTTDTQISSSWPDPSFKGKFLPENKEITTEGFSAQWGVNYLNRNFPQTWYDGSYKVSESSFGVYFLIPVDHYQKSERSVKYAFMFIALTFLVFFLTEVIIRKKIHPIQYLLVGFALIIFYTLLISLAEQIGFNLAYLISTVAVTALIGFYMKSSISSGKVGLISSVLLLALYGFLYTTLQLQELALLMGSVGLFLILAVIMIVSRKVNWYKDES